MLTYEELVAQAKEAYETTDVAGWKLARLTFDAVTELLDSGMNKEEALKKWIEDLDREGFGITSARRYFTVWDKYGDLHDRLVSEVSGKELPFAEHYAAVKGGQEVTKRLVRGQSMRASARTPEMVAEQAAARHEAAIEAAGVIEDDEVADTDDLAKRVNKATAAAEYVIAWLGAHNAFTDEQEAELRAFEQDIEKVLAQISERL